VFGAVSPNNFSEFRVISPRRGGMDDAIVIRCDARGSLMAARCFTTSTGLV
jgi:hypothetical protein